MMRNVLVIEIIWWMVSISIGLLVLLPIYFQKINYPFYVLNFIFVLGFLTCSRWLFLWKFTPYARIQILKLCFIFLFIPIIFSGIIYFSDFRNYIDEIGLQEMVQHLPSGEQDAMSHYIRNEMVFFAVCFILVSILIPFKMVWNIWTQHNRGEV